MPNRRIAENTVLSFQQAVNAKVHGLEFDVRLSKDGQPVIFHDENLIRLAGDARKIKDLTVKELAGVELRGAGNIPTLNDITTAFPSPLFLDIEIKDPDATEPIIAKLKTSSALRERTIVSSFFLDVLKKFRDELPEIKRVVLMHTWVAPGRRRTLWPQVFEVQPWAFGTRVGSLNVARMDFLHKHDCLAAAYEDRPSMRAAKRMKRIGVDIAITFRPDVILG